MKNMKLIFLCLMATAQTAIATPKLGGNSGGGGDLSPPRTITEEELADFLRNKVATLSAWHFNMMLSPLLNVDTESTNELEFPLGGHEAGKKLRAKLTTPPLDIFAAIRTARINVQTEPCYDPETNERRDASAHRENMTVCFDAHSMWLKHQTSTVYNHALALAIHEFTHLVGTDETEAVALERLALGSIKVSNHALTELQDDWNETLSWKDKTENALTLNMLIEDCEKLSSIGLAFALTALDKDITEELTLAFMKQTKDFLGPLNGQNQKDIYAVYFRISNLKNFMSTVPHAFEFRGIEKPLV